MILEIQITNLFSIDETVVLDMRAAPLRTKKSVDMEGNLIEIGKEKVLKTAAIYGANASGKSNIINAIRFCCSLVFRSHDYNQNTIFDFEPFKFNDPTKPSVFFIRFISKGIEYEYSYEFTREVIQKESLYYYPKGRRAKVFERDHTTDQPKEKQYSFASGVIKRPFDVVVNTSQKTLFISRASQMDRELTTEIFHFFAYTFLLDYHKSFETPWLESLFDKYKPFLLEALQLADSDIVDVDYRKKEIENIEVQVSEKNQQASIKRQKKEGIKIYTYHRSDPSVAFDFFVEESTGTQKLFLMLLTIIGIINEDRILLVDELEESFHSHIVDYIIQLFHHSQSAQMIFTTHNTNLLSLDKLRRDQIWFVNKNDKGSSELYSLYDFKDFRDNMDLEKAYLNGRFDAVPFVSDVDQLIKNIQNNGEKET